MTQKELEALIKLSEERLKKYPVDFAEYRKIVIFIMQLKERLK